MAKIDAAAQIARHGANLRELLKELSKSTLEKNQKHIKDKIQKETFELCNLITAGIQQGSLVGDPTGVIMGKSVFGAEVDAAANAWFDADVAATTEANKKALAADPKASALEPRALTARKALAALSAQGADTGPWKRVVMRFRNGGKMILEKGRHIIQVCYGGFTFVVNWFWRNVVNLWNLVVRKSKALGAWVAGWFKRNPKPAVEGKSNVVEVSETDLTQIDSASPLPA